MAETPADQHKLATSVGRRSVGLLNSRVPGHSRRIPEGRSFRFTRSPSLGRWSGNPRLLAQAASRLLEQETVFAYEGPVFARRRGDDLPPHVGDRLAEEREETVVLGDLLPLGDFAQREKPRPVGRSPGIWTVAMVHGKIPTERFAHEESLAPVDRSHRKTPKAVQRRRTPSCIPLPRPPSADVEGCHEILLLEKYGSNWRSGRAHPVKVAQDPR